MALARIQKSYDDFVLPCKTISHALRVFLHSLGKDMDYVPLMEKFQTNAACSRYFYVRYDKPNVRIIAWTTR